jgi:hypothetical protein
MPHYKDLVKILFGFTATHEIILHLSSNRFYFYCNKKTKLRGFSPQTYTIPTERPQPVGEVSVNFS